MDFERALTAAPTCTRPRRSKPARLGPMSELFPAARLRKPRWATTPTVLRKTIGGAGAGVTHGAAPNEIFEGIPARRMRFRFGEAAIAVLRHIRWRDRAHEQLKKRIADFLTIEGFCEKYDPLTAGLK